MRKDLGCFGVRQTSTIYEPKIVFSAVSDGSKVSNDGLFLVLPGNRHSGISRSDVSEAIPAHRSGTNASPEPTAKLTGRREAQVNAVAFTQDSQDPSKLVGMTSPITVRVEPNGTGNPSVGISEEYVSSVGDQWRSSAWLAAFNACQALNIPITSIDVLFQTRGAIDPAENAIRPFALGCQTDPQPKR
jgi:hypothetical protein